MHDDSKIFIFKQPLALNAFDALAAEFQPAAEFLLAEHLKRPGFDFAAYKQSNAGEHFLEATFNRCFEVDCLVTTKPDIRCLSLRYTFKMQVYLVSDGKKLGIEFEALKPTRKKPKKWNTTLIDNGVHPTDPVWQTVIDALANLDKPHWYIEDAA